MVKRLAGELVSGVKGDGFNLNFALEKAADEPKKAIVEAKLKILINRLNLICCYFIDFAFWIWYKGFCRLTSAVFVQKVGYEKTDTRTQGSRALMDRKCLLV